MKTMCLLWAASLAFACSESAGDGENKAARRSHDQSAKGAKGAGPAKGNAPGKRPGESKAPGQRKSRPALVELAPVTGGPLNDGWTYLGRVEPALAADLATAVGGHVVKVKPREGDRVAKNNTILVLDSARVRAELAASRAREKGLESEVAHARKQYERVSKLEYPAVSEPERERFLLDLNKLEAQLAAQRADSRRLLVDIDRHSIEAPFAGVISARHVDPGAWVNSGTPVLSLVSLEEQEVHVDVSADLGSRLRVGDAATLVGAQRAPAEVAGIVGVLDADTRTMRVRLVPAQPTAWLLSGMAIDVEFNITIDSALVGADGLVVPRDALVRGPVRTRLIKYVAGQAVTIYVDVLATAGAQALVRPQADEPALALGDQVVVRGNERLRPGQSLRVAE